MQQRENSARRDKLRQLGSAALRVLFGALVAMGCPQSLDAADWKSTCCDDLEARIAELEATAARKGNRKVSLTVSGQVSKALLHWDDGHENNTYAVGNKNDQSNINFTGRAEVGKGWNAGFDITLRMRDDLSDDVDQANDSGSGDTFQLWQAHWWIEGEQAGKISIGRVSRVSNTAPERDLSGTAAAGFSGIQESGAAFTIRRTDGRLLGLNLGSIYGNFNGDTANLARYDTPSVLGFTASASWGEDDIWDAGLTFEGEGGGIQLVASVACTEIRDTDGAFADTNSTTLVGSAAILHESSGLNALVSFGVRAFDQSVRDADGVLRTPEDAKFVYVKIGWLAKLNALGSSGFYAEWGRFQDFVSVQHDAGLVAALDASGTAQRIAGNTAEAWGFGVVQQIDAAEMQIYLGYRLHETDFDLLTGTGAAAPSQRFEDFHTFLAGSKITF